MEKGYLADYKKVVCQVFFCMFLLKNVQKYSKNI